jgi:hypothetical protein
LGIPKEEYIGKEIPIQDEELEKEIERTEADVDDCIRRREIRARVSVARPVGKHMSEEERDLVCVVSQPPPVVSQPPPEQHLPPPPS